MRLYAMPVSLGQSPETLAPPTADIVHRINESDRFVRLAAVEALSLLPDVLKQHAAKMVQEL